MLEKKLSKSKRKQTARMDVHFGKEALNGVKSGKYYASIVIPEDFSRSLISILSGDLQTPKLDYYINEKPMPLLPKSQAQAQPQFRNRSTAPSLRLLLNPFPAY